MYISNGLNNIWASYMVGWNLAKIHFFIQYINFCFIGNDGLAPDMILLHWMIYQRCTKTPKWNGMEWKSTKNCLKKLNQMQMQMKQRCLKFMSWHHFFPLYGRAEDKLCRISSSFFFIRFISALCLHVSLSYWINFHKILHVI